MSNGSVMSCENTQHGIFPYGRLKCECQKPLPYTHVWSELSCRCEKVFSLVNPVVPFVFCKLTESVWSVSVEPGNASGGWLGHYRWTRKKVCFLTLVNQVNGPLGGRSRVPNGLIREEEVDDGNEQQREGHGLTHLQPSTFSPPLQPHVLPRTPKSPGSQPGHIYSAGWTSALALKGRRWNVNFMSL